jgi:hypothetical protein
MSVLITGFAAFFAGIATGLVGLSAAAVMVPVLTTVLGMDAYMAVGIALASDVLASALSAKTYYENGNIEVRNGLLMSGTVLVFTLIASYFSAQSDNSGMGSMMNVFAIFLGFRFFFKKENGKSVPDQVKYKRVKSILFGALIGTICGYMGAGGGVMMLMILTRVLQYDVKTAVGTSVLIMTATAFTGAVGHIVIGGTDWLLLFVAVFAGVGGALLASGIANKVSVEQSNKLVGAFLILFGLVLTIIKNLAIL